MRQSRNEFSDVGRMNARLNFAGVFFRGARQSRSSLAAIPTWIVRSFCLFSTTEAEERLLRSIPPHFEEMPPALPISPRCVTDQPDVCVGTAP